MFSSQNSQVSSDANFIEDVFSTYLYTGTGAAQTITNGIDLAGKGGLVWTKSRSNAISNINVDTVRGGINALITNSTAANSADTGFHISSFNSNGYSLQGAGSGDNTSGYTYVSWTFREQPKFFDVVTYTGTGAVQNIAHNLGSVPGCVITKKTSATSNWAVYHRGITSSETGAIILNLTDAFVTSAAFWNNTAPTSTQFTVGTAHATNVSGQTYVAYLFAHNAGGFGLTGADNVISCGSFTTNGSGIATVALGYEPQWLLVKANASGNDWYMYDNMRGLSYSNYVYLSPNLSAAEGNIVADYLVPTATGFNTKSFASSTTYIYIAIRRGPMKVPTLGTRVFGISARTGTGANATVTGGSSVDDAVLIKNRGAAVGNLFASRLTGTGYLETSATTAEVAAGVTILQANPWDVMDGVKVGTTSTITNASANTFVNYLFSRAPGFFDVVCYTGTGVARTVAHNLAAVPELIIVKPRNSSTYDWNCYHVSLGNTKYIALDTALAASSAASLWNNTTPTSTVFSVSHPAVNDSGGTYIAYLFATCVGVSKVGSYTGTGALQTVACGFTSGARFVLIKRTDSTGDWYVWDSARGITSGNDPYLLMNSTAAEVTSTNYVDTDTTGFKVTAAAPAGINASGGTYIFLAIA